MSSKSCFCKIEGTIFSSLNFGVYDVRDVLRGNNFKIKGNFDASSNPGLMWFSLTNPKKNSKDKTRTIEEYSMISQADLDRNPKLWDPFLKSLSLKSTLLSDDYNRILSLEDKNFIEDLLYSPDTLIERLEIEEDDRRYVKNLLMTGYSKPFLMLLLRRKMVPNVISLPLIDKYGVSEILTLIRDNPYNMVLYFGASMKRIDGDLAVKQSLKEFENIRVRSSILDFAFQNVFSNGSMRSSISNIKPYVEKFYPKLLPFLDNIDDILYELVQSGLIFKEGDKYSPFAIYNMEKESYNYISYRLNNTSPISFNSRSLILDRFEERQGFPPSSEQESLIDLILNNSIVSLQGKAGTGKTTAVYLATEVLREKGISFSVLTTTGRAAKILSDRLGCSVRTVHSYLGFNGVDFSTEISSDEAIIVDEFSMCDSFLFYALLRTIKSKCRIILVGDINQLPPVGPGSVFHDLIESGVIPTLNLQEVHRQSEGSLILDRALTLLDTSMININSGNDFMTLPLPSYESFYNMSLDFYKKSYSKDKTCCIISPIKDGPLGVGEINRFLQRNFNPNFGSDKTFGNVESNFYIKDRVMFTRNDNALKVCNGDIGVIRDIQDKDVYIDLNGRVLDFKIHTISFQLTLAYVTTIHKAQGSEFDNIMMILPNGCQRMLTKNLLYTGLTRASSRLLLAYEDVIGHILQHATFNDVYGQHDSWLKDLLCSWSPEAKKPSLLDDFLV